MNRHKVSPRFWSPSRFFMGFFVSGVVLSILFSSPLLDANPVLCSSVQAEKKVLTAEQTLRIWSVGDLQLSQDGRHLALTVTPPAKENTRNSDIWVYDTGSRRLVQFTSSEKADYHARWYPDGGRLAFLSGRSEKTQIYVISLEGGEALALTDSKTPVQAFEWSPDGKRIVFMAREPKTEEQEKKEKEKDDAWVVDAEDIPARLWLFDVASKDVSQLTEGEWRISSFCWTPDGERLVVAATDQNRPTQLTDRLYSLRVNDGALKEIAGPARPFGNVQVSPDGKSLAYVGTRQDGPTAPDLYLMPLEGGEAVNLTRSSLDRSVSGFRWKKDGTLALQAAKGFATSLYDLDLEGHIEELKSFGDVCPSGSFASGPGFLAFVGQNATQMPELWVSDGQKAAEKISSFNKDWDAVTLVEPEIFTYSSFDGMEIEAALLRPSNYVKGTRIPLIVLVHGGPAGRWSYRFDAWGQLLVQRGYAVLYPNIRGSVGYGFDFVAANRKDWGGGDFEDVMAGVDVMVAKGVADPEHLGIGGWSYGGYMAAWAVTQTDRFEVSVSGAPMTDLASEYGTESAGINAYDTWYMGTPYENLELFQARSPVTYVEKVKTPTLLLSGENDATDPIGQCQQFYRGLRRYGVKTEFVVYPREGHGIREEKHRVDLLHRIIAWFDKHI
jgi:dipeptidyl aminopeptidase/acylaminoacyl peptidase